jgi:ethanolamine utilization protein EutA (predicted chaperonin)
MKKILAAVILCALMLLTACGSMTEKEDILALTRENEEFIINVARRGNYSEVLISEEVFHVYYDMDCVVFSTGADGLLTDTRTGFYYSFDGNPCGAGYANKWKFTEDENGWYGENVRTGSKYRTEHLFGNFYYFEGTW